MTDTETIEITKAILQRLRRELRRTRVSPRDILKGRLDAPTGLTSRVINRWLLRTTGTATRHDLDYVFALYASRPDASSFTNGQYAPKAGRRVAPANGEWLTLDDAMTDLLSSEIKRTGLASLAFLERVDNKPPGLTIGMLNLWAKGAVKTVNPEFWSFVVSTYAALPDKALLSARSDPERFGLRYNASHRPIPPEKLRALREHRDRTGITPTQLLRDAQPMPGLDARLVSNWLRGTTRSATPDLLDRVLALYAAYPSPR